MTLAEARDFALSLPETTEKPHFDKASFRVRGKIFATAPPDGEHLHVFIAEHETRSLAAECPEAYSQLWWGKKLAGVRVVLAAAEVETVRELLEDAWSRRAPAALRQSRPARGHR